MRQINETHTFSRADIERIIAQTARHMIIGSFYVGAMDDEDQFVKWNEDGSITVTTPHTPDFTKSVRHAAPCPSAQVYQEGPSWGLSKISGNGWRAPSLGYPTPLRVWRLPYLNPGRSEQRLMRECRAQATTSAELWAISI